MCIRDSFGTYNQTTIKLEEGSAFASGEVDTAKLPKRVEKQENPKVSPGEPDILFLLLESQTSTLSYSVSVRTEGKPTELQDGIQVQREIAGGSTDVYILKTGRLKGWMQISISLRSPSGELTQLKAKCSFSSEKDLGNPSSFWKELQNVPTLLSLVEGKVHYLIDMQGCLLYTSPSPRDRQKSRMPSSA
eukprot:TRINITY_DN20644_c0_g1_i1.p1 TRINITY_DN20644_c0_g1~~TRINITY_DN20644_c0_g1_i1.p1  ORF type:complete len:190 (-),score=42.74 TRINITY_DN20644_c0_g1_i1:10-579(-)